MRGWFPRISRDVLRISRGCLARAGDGAVVARRFLAGHVWQTVAAGVALVAVIAATLAATSSGSGTSPRDAAPRAHQLVLPAGALPVRVSAADLAKLPRATTYTSIPSAPRDPAPFAVASGLVVRPLTPQVLYAGPGKPPVAVLPTTELGGPTWVPVVQTSPGWERVLLPSRPNRLTGWIYTGATGSSQLDTRRSAYLVRIKVGARKLSAYYDGRPLGTWTVAVGAPATPTPTGRTFLLALLAPPHPTYSPLILPLGFHSNTLTTFGGGPGTVGLHGWPDSSVFGRAVSHGCVRVPATALHVLSQVPLGSLVLITA
jgi:lipoprotein-anchoring transpeptidase ErfK/SrfK